MNVADILTKPLSPQSYYSILRMILFKRDSSDNQGELQQVQQHIQDTSTVHEHAELTNRTESDSQALSHAQESATEHSSSVEQLYPEA